MISHLRRGAFGAAACMLVSAPALGHAVLEPPDAQPNSTVKAAVRISHGCKGSPTTAVTVMLPEGAIGARPMAKPGWSIAVERGPYGRSYPVAHGAALAEGAKAITWSGNTLPDDQFDEFVFSVRMSDAFQPGATVYFPVVQSCETGATRWAEIPGPGQDPHALEAPAPGIRILPAAATSSAAAAPESPPGDIKAGTLTISRPWLRATPGGAKVAGGYLRIANTGPEPDRLLSASLPLATRGEVHEMSTEGGVMKMRALEGGLDIAPGQTVELKPGGYHLMFMDMKAGLKEGETVRGTLTFQKAGTVEVSFPVSGLGAREAPTSPHQHH